MTDEEQLPAPKPKPRGVRISGFVLVLVLGLAVVFIPLESVAEVNSGGGAAAYCRAEGAPPLSQLKANPRSGMIQCVDGKPVYFPAPPLYFVGGVLVLIGSVGTITRTVRILRRRFAS